jgi:hypothetical protein
MFKAIFFLALAINFFLPILAILKRDAKRNFWTVGFVSIMLIFGHYLDFYHMVMVEPMAAGHHGEAHGDDHADDHSEDHANLSAENILYAQLVADNHEEGAHEVHAEEAHDEEHGLMTDSHSEESHAEEAHGVVAGADDHGHDAHGEGEVLTHAKLGLVELLFFLGFLGMFLFMTFTGLDGEDLESVEDPFLEESKNHHVKYS